MVVEFIIVAVTSESGNISLADVPENSDPVIDTIYPINTVGTVN